MERDGGADGADELEREAARAAAVEQLELLGAPVDGELDAVVRVAAALAGAQHATVTLLGARRQCLLADGAFRDTDPASGELPCARVVRGGRTVHVPDASAVPELAATAWVDGREGVLRMYASVPLVTAEGHAVGTLCVGDPAPRALGDDVLARLEDLAGVVVALLERRLTARRAAALAAEAHEQRCRAERTLAALEERTELAEAVLDSLDVGVVAAGPDGRLTLFNRAAQRWHGLPADPALAPGEHPGRYALFEADGTTPLAPERVPLHRALAEGRVLAQEIVIAPSGSPPRTVLVSGRAMARPDGRPLGAVVAQHDVTTERRHRRALEQAHRALAERTAELERSNAELERFAAAASHDLRSPLTVVEGYLELIEDTCGEELPERAAEWLATGASASPPPPPPPPGA